jgi:hypothetical protein
MKGSHSKGAGHGSRGFSDGIYGRYDPHSVRRDAFSPSKNTMANRSYAE